MLYAERLPGPDSERTQNFGQNEPKPAPSARVPEKASLGRPVKEFPNFRRSPKKAMSHNGFRLLLVFWAARRI
jgi:hypothetical protein